MTKLTYKNGVIGGYGVVFTDADNKDLEGDYFTAETNLWMDQYPAVPLLFEHGQDSDLGTRVVGMGKPVRKDSVGVWYESQLYNRDRYEAAIMDLVEKGVLGYSTGSMPHLVDSAPDGRLLSWPVVELSLTTSPAAGPYLTSVSQVRGHYKAALLKGDFSMNEKERLMAIIRDNAPGVSDEVAESICDAIMAGGASDGGGESAPMDEATVKAFVVEALKSASGVNEARVKAMIDAALKPYIQPNSATPPANTAPRDETKADKANAIKAFNLYLHRGVRPTGAAAKAMEGGTGSEGGYTVPTDFYAELVQEMREESIIRMAGARVISLTTNSTEIPTMTDSGAAVLTDEEGDYDNDQPSFGQATFSPYKLTRETIVSEELAEDSVFDIWGGILAPDFAQAFAAAENSYFTVGTGSSQPQGVVTGAGVGVTAAAVDAVTADEIIDLFHSLGYLYRQRAVWMMNDLTIKAVRKLKDGDGQYLWQPGLQAGQPETLLGRPLITNNSMATMAADAKSVLFGDMRYYWIGERSAMTVDRNPFLYMKSGQVAYFARKRVDGHVMLAAAFKVLQMAAS